MNELEKNEMAMNVRLVINKGDPVRHGFHIFKNLVMIVIEDTHNFQDNLLLFLVKG